MRRPLLLACLVSALAAAALPSVARADDAAVAEATKRFNEGLDLADAGRPEEARLKFQQAAAVLKAPAVLYNLARAEQLTSHDYEALEHFKQFLRASQNDPKVTDAMRDKARANIAELARKVGQIDIDAPPTARISIDGKPLEEPAKEPVAVPPGRHVVEAAFEGKIKSVSVDCGAGQVVRAKIAFDPSTVEPPPPGGEGGGGSTKWIVAGGLGVLGLAGIGVGVGFAMASQSAKDTENAKRQPGVCVDQNSAACRDLDAARKDVDDKAVLSTVGYVAGGALLAGAIVTAVVWPSSKKTGSRVVVSPTANGGTIHWGATF
jgi:hypothetical protein